jgi:antitoxin component YwqK of YwqJK toxin-antitoxin module
MRCRPFAAGLGLTLAGLCAAAQPLWSDNPRVTRAARLWLIDQQPMTGELLRREADGNVSVLPLREGLLHGTVKSHDVNGQPRSEGAYVQGQAHGVHRAWWPNGHLRSEQSFERDMPQGLSKTWYPSGHPYEEHRYEHGQEAGLQRMWFEDQRLRASYEVRNGRRFGNIGAMGCAGGDKPARGAP